MFSQMAGLPDYCFLICATMATVSNVYLDPSWQALCHSGQGLQ